MCTVLKNENVMTSNVIENRQTLRKNITRPSREKGEFRADEILWLDKNENMDPQYIAFIQGLLTDLPPKALFSYPDCHVLYKKLAQYLNVAINELILAAGSDGVIRAVYDAFVAPGDTVIYTTPTFAMYELYAHMHGAKSVSLDYLPSEQGPLLTSNTVINAIKIMKPRLMCLPNPNSPSGTVFTPQEMYSIIKMAHETETIILVDEAYHPFYPETVLGYINEFPNLIVARTFSKAWGCAGIRLGYGIACQTLMDDLHKIRPMYEGGALSFTVAERLLDNADQMLASVQRLNAGKAYFLKAMHDLGLRTLNSEGNFLHVAFGEYADKVHKVLADKVLYRNNFSHPSLAGFSRFSATTEEVFLPLVTQIKNIIHQHKKQD
jgi:histidinol-phosphate aminotransferase